MDEIYKAIDGMGDFVIVRAEKLYTWQTTIVPALTDRYPSLRRVPGSATAVTIMSKTVRFIALGREDLMFGRRNHKVAIYERQV